MAQHIGEEKEAKKIDHAIHDQAIHDHAFDSIEECWFWFIQAFQAAQDGARFTAGLSVSARPCEPIDIYTIVERLYKTRQLKIDHIKIMRRYGERRMVPDRHWYKQRHDFFLWRAGLEKLAPYLEQKGIIKKDRSWIGGLGSNVVAFDQHNSSEGGAACLSTS